MATSACAVYFCTQAVKVSVSILVLFIQMPDLAASNPAQGSLQAFPREQAANNFCKEALAQWWMLYIKSPITRGGGGRRGLPISGVGFMLPHLLAPTSFLPFHPFNH